MESPLEPARQPTHGNSSDRRDKDPDVDAEIISQSADRTKSNLTLPSTCHEVKRPSWGRHLEFIVTCVGFAVGLGNVWRFPHLAYTNGGGAFLIPYTISLLLLGIPLFCLEILFGQFASLGPIAIWEINLCFKGLGYSMVILAIIISIYYNVIVATAMFYLFASMQSALPWSRCGNPWNTCYCRTSRMNISLKEPMLWYNSTGLNCSGIIFTSESVVSSSEEYYYKHVLERTSGIQDMGVIKWDLTLCNLVAWIIVLVCLIQGVSTMGKAVYFFALFPYVILTVLLVRGATLEGAAMGIKYYVTPDFTRLLDAAVWKDAASQIIFSLSCCTGSLTAMASYNKFQNNVLRDSIVIPLINCFTSIYAGFAIFSILGFMAHYKGVSVNRVTREGPGLVFIAYPEALAELPAPQFWSCAFFFMMICLGLGTQFPSVESILTALQDEFEVFRRTSVATEFRVIMCFLGFLLGIPMTTQGGNYVVDLLDLFVALPLLIVGFLEIVAIVWIYGYRRFKEDVMLMVGFYPKSKCLFWIYYSWNWLVVTPTLIVAIVIFECIQYKPIISEAYPLWAEILGWLVVGFTLMWTPVWYAAVFLCSWRGNGYQNACQVLYVANQPTSRWGPRLEANRGVIRYQTHRKSSALSSGTSGLEIPPPQAHSVHSGLTSDAAGSGLQLKDCDLKETYSRDKGVGGNELLRHQRSGDPAAASSLRALRPDVRGDWGGTPA